MTMKAISILALAVISASAAAQNAAAPVAAAPAVAPAAASSVVTESKPQPLKRDPFISPLVRADRSLGSNCNVGKRCLAIEQIELKGVIAAQSGMVALVVNSANRAYFLRQNDAVFNGVVEQITRDSVTFRQNVYDSLGRLKGTREVVRKISGPVV